MALFVPIIIAGVFVTVFVCIVLFICHKKRVIKEQHRRRRRYQKQAEAQQQGLYTFPHFSPDELDAAQPLSEVYIHQSPTRDQQQQQRKNHEDIHRVAANLLNNSSGQRAEQQQLQQLQQQQQQQKQSPQQQRNRAANLPRTSPDSHPPSLFLELSPLPAAYQQQGSSRRNPDRTNNSPVQEPGTLLSAPRAKGSGSDDDNSRRAGSNYLVQPSPLPRPLHLRRPIVTDTSITPSSKVVATIGRGVPLVVQDDESNSPIEPPVVIIGKSPVLMAMGASMRTHSPSSATTTTESYKATLPPKSTARRESIRRQTTTTTQTPTQTQVSLGEAQTQAQIQTQQRTPHHQGGIQFPTRIAEEQEFADESDNPFMSKEEFKRPAPQAILPEGFKHAQFTLPLPPVPSQGNDLENDSSDDESNDLDTGRLVLEPYLTPAELAAHVPFPAPAVPHKYAKDSAPSSFADAADDQLINQSAAPTRPPRRATDASHQPNLSQSKIQEQRQQPQQQPQSAPPLASSADTPWPLVHRSPSPAPAPSVIPSHRPPPLFSSPSPTPSPSPSPTPSSLSNKSSSCTIRVKQQPPTLPPPRGSRSGSSSQTESERGMSPAPSLSYTSSNISTGLSIISSQPDTIIAELSSFVSLGDTPPTTGYMFCDSPVSPPVLSPTSPAFTGRSFSVSTTGSPTTPRFAPGHSPPIVEGHDYVWATEKGDDDEGEKVVVRQAKKPRVPEAVGGGTRLSHFNYDV